MGDDLRVRQAFGTYVVYLCLSLLVTIVVGLFLDGAPEPRTPQRLVLIMVFFTVFTLLFLWDAGWLNR